jgi:hypothetical protein
MTAHPPRESREILAVAIVENFGLSLREGLRTLLILRLAFLSAATPFLRRGGRN